MLKIKKIVSGGQTGADRGGLDAAIEKKVPIGGWVPKGRRAEDGTIPEKYHGLNETDTDNYLVRNRKNVEMADLTLIFVSGERTTGGSRRTEDYCLYHRKWHIVINTRVMPDLLLSFIVKQIKFMFSREKNQKEVGLVINVAGSRESKVDGIQEYTKLFMCGLIDELNGGECEFTRNNREYNIS